MLCQHDAPRLPQGTKSAPLSFSLFVINPFVLQCHGTRHGTSIFFLDCAVTCLRFEHSHLPVIRPQATLNDRETLETEVISASPSTHCAFTTVTHSLSAELLIHSYFNIVKREMIDMVPTAISLTLVNHSKEYLQRELLQELYKPDVLEDLLKESELVVARRKEVVSMVGALNKAEAYAVSFFLGAKHPLSHRIVAGV